MNNSPSMIYEQILAEDGHDNVNAFEFRMARWFDGVTVQGKTLIDIGSGRGLTALWALLQGCEHVVSMEPEEAGSTTGMIALQTERFCRLGYDNYEFLTCTFQEFDSHEQEL